MDNKASIGFTYGDSETVSGKNEPESSSEEEMQAEDIGTLDFPRKHPNII